MAVESFQGFSMKIKTNKESRTPNIEVVFRRGGDPAAQTGAGFDHHRQSLTLDVQGTLSLAQPAGGGACPTKNGNLEYSPASRMSEAGMGFNTNER